MIDEQKAVRQNNMAQVQVTLAEHETDIFELELLIQQGFSFKFKLSFYYIYLVRNKVGQLADVAQDNEEHIEGLRTELKKQTGQVTLLESEKKGLQSNVNAVEERVEVATVKLEKLVQESKRRQEEETKLNDETRNLKREQTKIVHRNLDLSMEMVKLNLLFKSLPLL